jgi:hypothetical protein
MGTVAMANATVLLGVAVSHSFTATEFIVKLLSVNDSLTLFYYGAKTKNYVAKIIPVYPL